MSLLADIVNPVVPSLQNGANAPSMFGKIVAGVIGVLLFAATLWAFFQLLLGGFSWISSSGDKGKLEAAQQRIMQAVIGLLIVFLAWGIFLIILRFFGITQGAGGEIQFELPTLF